MLRSLGSSHHHSHSSSSSATTTSPFDLAIHGKVYGDGKVEGWLYVKDGKIAKLSRERVGSADATVELTESQFVLPAATDLHVHLRDWSQSRKETIETGTKSALAGGVTTVADMPNTDPRVDSAELVEKRADLLRSKSYVDFAIHASPPASLGDLSKVHRAGAFALKLYPPELGLFRELIKKGPRAGLKVAVHAEDPSLTKTDQSTMAEGVAIHKLVQGLPRPAEVRFAHVSTVQGAMEILRARRTHKRVTMEVTPHHLYMSDPEADRRIGVTRKVNPSLRSESNCAGMRRLLKKGGVFDFYATDHAPHTVEEKFLGAPGFPALEFALPLLLTKTRDVDLVRRLYCEAPAEYLGIKKGKLSKGFTADLVVVGRRRWKVDPGRFVTKGRVTPFAGEVLSFAVDHVFKGGSTVYDGEEGRFIRTPANLVTHEQVH